MPLMMMGTPTRLGTTTSKPPPANAVDVIANKAASVMRTRMD
jgi:hypothetical protein